LHGFIKKDQKTPKKDENQPCSSDRFLDPDNESITLQTMKKAANAVGMRLRIELA
jgi:hypothetical protein